LLGVLDVAGLAMDAILIVDLKARILTVGITNDLEDARGAIALRRLVKQRQVDPDRDRRVGEPQVVRLILFMVRVRNEHRRQLVETDDPIGLGIDDLQALGGKLQALIVRLTLAQRPWN